MEPILQIKDLTKKYKNFTLDHVSMEIPQGMIYGLVGENGAGKTTTISTIFKIAEIVVVFPAILNMEIGRAHV